MHCWSFNASINSMIVKTGNHLDFNNFQANFFTGTDSLQKFSQKFWLEISKEHCFVGEWRGDGDFKLSR